MIYVPITSGNEESPRVGMRFFASLLGTFAIGAVLGVFASSEYEMRVPDLRDGLRSQLGAIGVLGEITPPTALNRASEVTTSSVTRETISPTIGVSNLAVALPVVSSAELPPLIPEREIVPTRTERERDVLAQQTAVDRLTLAMTQIKNASLALITEFDQNCGNWNDTCALPYSDTLEINNRTYEQLTKSRNSEMLVLLRYQTLLEETP